MDTRTGELFEVAQRDDGTLEPAVRMAIDKVQRLERAQAEGTLVAVSDEVARIVQIGSRVEDRRRKRKAATAARRRNRP